MVTKGITALLAIAGLILGIIIGGLGGAWYAREQAKSSQPKTTAQTETTATTPSESELKTCLKAKWGEAKYEAITANPQLASTDDKFTALPCYK